MDQAVSIITLGVADLAASRAFYSEGLGWTPLLDIPEIVFYQVAPGVAVGLFPLDELGEDAGHEATAGSSFTVAQNLASDDEVRAAVERFRRAGGTVLKEPQLAAVGFLHAYVADPDGHRWEIAHNPGWSVADDGTVRLGPIHPE
jgi:hypothetical protein